MGTRYAGLDGLDEATGPGTVTRENVEGACHIWSVHVSTLHTRSDFAHLSAARFPERVGSHTTASRREKRMAAPTEAALDSIRAVMRSGSIR